MTIRLLLADDQELIRSALAALLDLEEDFAVVASVGRGDEVVAAAKASRPDVALLDIEMPGIDGLAAAADPGRGGPDCRSLILTTFGRPGYLRRAMEAGAPGFIVKDAPAEAAGRRHPAGRRRRAGRRPRPRGRDPGRRHLAAHPARARRARRGAARAATVAEIAAALFLSEGTVRNYLSSAIAKTGARNRTEAVRIADERGWL